MNTLFIRILPILILLASCSANTGEFTLVNESEELIRRAHIEISSTVIELKEIMPQEKRVVSFKVNGDSHYEIEITFVSGKQLRDDVGYVTSGFDYKHTINISETDISLSNTEIK